MMRIWQQRQQPRNRKTVQIVHPVANAAHVVATVTIAEITAAIAATVAVSLHPVKAMAQRQKQRQQPKPQ